MLFSVVLGNAETLAEVGDRLRSKGVVESDGGFLLVSPLTLTLTWAVVGDAGVDVDPYSVVVVVKPAVVADPDKDVDSGVMSGTEDVKLLDTLSAVVRGSNVGCCFCSDVSIVSVCVFIGFVVEFTFTISFVVVEVDVSALLLSLGDLTADILLYTEVAVVRFFRSRLVFEKLDSVLLRVVAIGEEGDDDTAEDDDVTERVVETDDGDDVEAGNDLFVEVKEDMTEVVTSSTGSGLVVDEDPSNASFTVLFAAEGGVSVESCRDTAADVKAVIVEGSGFAVELSVDRACGGTDVEAVINVGVFVGPVVLLDN